MSRKFSWCEQAVSMFAHRRPTCYLDHAGTHMRKLSYGPNIASSVSDRSASRGHCGPLKYLRPRASL
jgi:hypothetical protein